MSYNNNSIYCQNSYECDLFKIFYIVTYDEKNTYSLYWTSFYRKELSKMLGTFQMTITIIIIVNMFF